MLGRILLGSALLAGALFAAPCNSPGNVTLADYASLGAAGCEIGQFNFSNFSYLFVGVGGGADADDINVTATVNGNNPGLTFTSTEWSTSGLVGAYNALLHYTVQSTGPDLRITGNTLTVVGSITGVAAASVLEIKCAGGNLTGPVLNICSSGITVEETASLPAGTNVNAQVNLLLGSPASLVDVVKNITLTSALGGSSMITSISQNYQTVNINAVPEPASMSLVGIGVLGAVLWRRRRACK